MFDGADEESEYFCEKCQEYVPPEDVDWNDTHAICGGSVVLVKESPPRQITVRE